MSCEPVCVSDIFTGLAIELYSSVIAGDFIKMQSGIMVPPPECLSDVIEATIGPCRQLDSTWTVNAADDER